MSPWWGIVYCCLCKQVCNDICNSLSFLQLHNLAALCENGYINHSETFSIDWQLYWDDVITFTRWQHCIQLCVIAVQCSGAGRDGFTRLQQSAGALHAVWISVTSQVKTLAHWSVSDHFVAFWLVGDNSLLFVLHLMVFDPWQSNSAVFTSLKPPTCVSQISLIRQLDSFGNDGFSYYREEWTPVWLMLQLLQNADMLHKFSVCVYYTRCR